MFQISPSDVFHFHDVSISVDDDGDDDHVYDREHLISVFRFCRKMQCFWLSLMGAV